MMNSLQTAFMLIACVIVLWELIGALYTSQQRRYWYLARVYGTVAWNPSVKTSAKLLKGQAR